MFLNKCVRILHIIILATATINLYCYSQGKHPTTGRPIAPVMSVSGAPWLERPERVAEERPDLAVKLLRLQEGMTVADIGAGSGYFTERLARVVGKSGRVYATDLQPGMLRLLESRKRERKLDNVEVVPGKVSATGLPSGSVDLALMVDVYHEFSEPQAMLKDLLRTLRVGGRLALLEYRKEDPDVPIIEEHKMTEKQAIAEVEAAGFRHLRTENSLPRQHLLLFEKPAPRGGVAIGEEARPRVQ